MENLAGSAMAKLRIKWLLSTQLILDTAAMAASFVKGLEVLVVGMDFVGSTEFPFVVLSIGLLGGAAGGLLCFVFTFF